MILRCQCWQICNRTRRPRPCPDAAYAMVQGFRYCWVHYQIEKDGRPTYLVADELRKLL